MVWKYDDKANTAKLTFKCDGGEKKTDKDKIRKLLQNEHSETMEFADDGSITITDVIAFKEMHTMQLVDIVVSKKAPNSPLAKIKTTFLLNLNGRVANESQSGSPNNTPQLLSPRTSRHTDLIAHDTSPALLRGSPRRPSDASKSGTRKGFWSVSLPDLILEELDSTLYRDSIAVLGTFQAVTENKAKILSSYLRTETSFSIELQLEKNREFYPAKAQLIKDVGSLFEALNPAYSTWARSKTTELRRSLYFYLQEAVDDVVKNALYNAEPTEFEMLSNSEKDDKFGGNNALLFFAIQKSREARAKVMLAKLSYLVSDFPVDVVAPASVDPSQVVKQYKELAMLYKNVAEDPELTTDQSDRLIKVKAFIDGINALIPFDPNLYLELTKTCEQKPRTLSQLRAQFLEAGRNQLSEAERFIEAKLRQITVSSFKEFIGDNEKLHEQIKVIIKLLKAHIIRICDVEQKYKWTNEQLHQQLHKAQVGDHFFSFKHVVLSYLVKKYHNQHKDDHSDNQDLKLIVKELCKALIIRLNGLKDIEGCPVNQLVPKLPTQGVDSNFYLSIEWVNGIKQVLEGADLTKLLKNPGKKSLVVPFINQMKKDIIDYFLRESIKIIKAKPQVLKSDGQDDIDPTTPDKKSGLM